ncbi:MAG: hypothetical protein H6Q84_3399 [Deltaproteobacteria bacterium]|nr:hypothetical protein [Deltaproteobacteria bacterium]
MTDEKEGKGYKVIDRRSGEEPPAATPPPKEKPPEVSGGNPRESAGVQQGKGDEAGDARKAGAPRFIDLVESLQMGVMANLGMLKMPDGKRSSVNLAEAQNIIDIIGILQEKTKGNLDQNEEEVLREGLYHLRMAYIAVQKATIPDLGKGGSY